MPTVVEMIANDGEAFYIVEYIEGETLKQCWLRLSWWPRFRTVHMVRCYVSQLKYLQSSVPGPVLATPRHGHMFTEYGSGRFTTHDEITEWFNHRLDVSQCRKKPPQDAPSLVRQILAVGVYALRLEHSECPPRQGRYHVTFGLDMVGLLPFMVRVYWDAIGAVQATSLVNVVYPIHCRFVTPLHSNVGTDELLGFFESTVHFRWNIEWALVVEHSL
jgi:hypothetical protein